MLKKLILAMAFVLMGSTFAFGAEAAIDVKKDITKYEFVVNDNRVAKTLELNQKQTEVMKMIHKHLNDKLVEVYYLSGSDNEVTEVVKGELRRIKPWMSKKQYNKYAKVVELTFVNRGFKMDADNAKKS